MLEKIEMGREDMVGFEVKGQLTASDYTETLMPLFEEARSQGRQIRFLFYLGPDFKSFSSEAAWEDFKTGWRYLQIFERCAIVSDIGRIRGASRFIGSLLPCPVQVFENEELQAAKDWLDAGEIALDHELDAATGVLTVQLSGPLSSEKFQILSDKIEHQGGQLKGLVLHAREFPGWEDVGSFISHVKFLKNQHTKIQRVALCVDGTLPSLAPELAKYFVKAEIKHFEFNDLEQAQKWAAQANGKEAQI